VSERLADPVRLVVQVSDNAPALTTQPQPDAKNQSAQLEQGQQCSVPLVVEQQRLVPSVKSVKGHL
jgi:hypothetical protein